MGLGPSPETVILQPYVHEQESSWTSLILNFFKHKMLSELLEKQVRSKYAQTPITALAHNGTFPLCWTLCESQRTHTGVYERLSKRH